MLFSAAETVAIAIARASVRLDRDRPPIVTRTAHTQTLQKQTTNRQPLQGYSDWQNGRATVRAGDDIEWGWGKKGAGTTAAADAPSQNINNTAKHTKPQPPIFLSYSPPTNPVLRDGSMGYPQGEEEEEGEEGDVGERKDVGEVCVEEEEQPAQPLPPPATRHRHTPSIRIQSKSDMIGVLRLRIP